MNKRRSQIIELIEHGVESDIVDFKEKYYHEAKKSDFIKDIISFANAATLDEKFIIFGISDSTREAIGISKEEIPDISNVNQLIRTYCDPFIEIDIERFTIDHKNIAAIVIKKTNLQKPYVVAKDMSNRDKICLHAGDIYIRKSANNFRALRSDIEAIYKSRLLLEIASVNNTIKIRNIEISKIKQKYACIPVCFANSTDNVFVLNKATAKWIYADCQAGSPVLYVDEEKTQFKQAPIAIEQKPFVLGSKTQEQRVFYLNISESFCRVIKKHEEMRQDLRIELIISDARGFEYTTSFTADTIIWDE